MVDLSHAEIVVPGSPAQVMGVIADLPNYPLWSAGIAAATVLDRFGDGRPRRARLGVDMGPFQDEYVLEYDWDADRRVDWRLVQGGLITSMEGTYTCRDNGDGTTTVGYDLSLELDLPLIGTVQQRGERHIPRPALRGRRPRVRARAGGGSGEGAAASGAAPAQDNDGADPGGTAGA